MSKRRSGIDKVECILQAYAVQILEDCDTWNMEFINKFLEAYALFRTYKLALNCDNENAQVLIQSLLRYTTNMECRTCGNC